MDKFNMNDNDMDKYVRLIIKRDQLLKEAACYEDEYLREFGEEMLNLYEEKVKCIEVRKKIHHCQARVNHHDPIDREKMEKMVFLEMQDYYENLKGLQNDVKQAKEMKQVSAYTAMEAKRHYRNIAKMVHPDIQPLAKENAFMREVWERAVKAYRACEADELAEIELVTARQLKRLGIKETEIPPVDQVEEKIERIRNQINHIINTDPYQYRELLLHPELVEERHDELLDEMMQYQNYRIELEKMLELFLSEGDVTILWKMD